MFTVDEPTATAIRKAYAESGELSAVVKLPLSRDRGQRECPAVCAHDRQLAAVAAFAPEEATNMSDQIIDAVMARSIQADAVRTHPLAAWVLDAIPPASGSATP